MEEDVGKGMKPCPSCGGEATGCKDVEPTAYRWTVTCKGCRLSTRHCMTREEAVESWNCRTLQDEDGLETIIRSIVSEAVLTDNPYGVSDVIIAAVRARI